MDNRKQHHVIFILDRSGSMAPQTNDVIGGFNSCLQDLQEEAKADGLETLVSLVSFADSSTITFGRKPVSDVPNLTHRDYRAVGSTALYDAVYDTVSQYRESIGQGVFGAAESDGPSVLVNIFTDGEENASRHATQDQVQRLVKECEALGNWTFTYIGAHEGAGRQAAQMCVSPGNVLDAKDMSMHEASERMRTVVKDHRAAYRDHGQKMKKDLFTLEGPEPPDVSRN